MGFSQQNWIEPKFRIFFGRFNMHMDRLFSFPTEKEKPVTMVSKNFWHTLQNNTILWLSETFLIGTLRTSSAWLFNEARGGIGAPDDPR